jgi:hypothetical protein
MRRQRWQTVAAVAAAVTTLMASAALANASGAARGVVTGRAAQLVATAPGVGVRPILSAGDVVGGELLGYQMSGIPDGIGAYRSSRTTVEVLVTHELAGEAPAGVGARISQLTLNNKRQVLAARHLLDGTEGFLRFCSATLEQLDGVPWYFTGEEATDAGEPPTGGRGGSSIALNALTGRYTETRHFGLFEHENVVPVKHLNTAMIVSTEDGDANKSQLYAYTADSFAKAIKGEGQLRVWAPDHQGDGDPSSNDIASGQTLHGRFVPVSQDENADAESLEAAAQAKGAFDFVRAEDLAVSENRRGETWLADTGSAGAESERGRLYRFRIDPSNPTKASLTLVLDGDDGDDIVNPDNLDVSKRGRGHPGGPQRRASWTRGGRRLRAGPGLRPPHQAVAAGRPGEHRPVGPGCPAWQLGVLRRDRRLAAVRRGLVAGRRPGPQPDRTPAWAGPEAQFQRGRGRPAAGQPHSRQHLAGPGRIHPPPRRTAPPLRRGRTLALSAI